MLEKLENHMSGTEAERRFNLRIANLACSESEDKGTVTTGGVVERVSGSQAPVGRAESRDSSLEGREGVKERRGLRRVVVSRLFPRALRTRPRRGRGRYTYIGYLS